MEEGSSYAPTMTSLVVSTDAGTLAKVCADSQLSLVPTLGREMHLLLVAVLLGTAAFALVRRLASRSRGPL
jgi:hypothetical protein